MPAVWGFTVGAALSTQIELLWFCPCWAVIGFIGSGL